MADSAENSPKQSRKKLSHSHSNRRKKAQVASVRRSRTRTSADLEQPAEQRQRRHASVWSLQLMPGHDRNTSTSSHDSTFLSDSDEGDLAGCSPMMGFKVFKQTLHAKILSEDEYVYRRLLKCVLNPLGNADPRFGCRPYELAIHLRKVFQVSAEDHLKWVKELQNNKPSNVVLITTVVEAKDLEPMDSNGLSDPYCILSVVHPGKKVSPMASPRNSPKTGRRRSSLEHGEVLRTHTIQETLNPKWNEQFEMDVGNIDTDELVLYMWDSDEGENMMDSMRQLEKPSGLRSIFRHIKQTVEYGKSIDDFIGQITVPLKSIPAAGCDEWFDLYLDRKNRKPRGKCRLKMELSIKQDLDELDSAESDQCSIDEYYSIIKQVYQHAIATLLKENDKPVLKVPEESMVVINQFSIQNHINKLTQTLVQMVVTLEVAVDQRNTCVVPDKMIKDFTVDLELEYYNQQQNGTNRFRLYQNMTKLLLTETELQLFDRAATTYIHMTVQSLTDLPVMFPPCQMQWEDINNKVSMMVGILNLHLWSDNDKSRQDLSHLLVQRLRDDVKHWMEGKLRVSTPPLDAKDPIIPELRSFTGLLEEVLTHLTPIFSVTQHFGRLGIDYYTEVSLFMESRLAKKTIDLMEQLDRYQKRYQKYRVNIHESSKVSIHLYLTLRRLYGVIQENTTERDHANLVMKDYQEWFNSAVTFWLQTFKHETLRRLEKALEIEKDVVQVTSLVKHSSSSVDVLSCFAKVTEEWTKIGFQDADIALMGITKITDMICDGARQYADKTAMILEQRGWYYEMDGSSHFDVTDQLCFTLNNMENVRTYLIKVVDNLQWEEVCKRMSDKHQNEAIGKQSLDMLHRLTSSSNTDILMKSKMVQKTVTEKMTVDVKQQVEKFAKNSSSKIRHIDPLMAYIDSNMKKLHERLEGSIFPQILEEIWCAVLRSIDGSMLVGQLPEYYTSMSSHVRALKTYFNEIGVEENRMSTRLLQNVKERIEINSLSSEELMLSYLRSLCQDNLMTPLEYFGHCAVKVGYVQETCGYVTLHIKVISGDRLPGINKRNTCNPVVICSLLPHTLFQVKKRMQTRVIHNTSMPVFNETFHCTRIPQEFLNKEGASAVFSVWNYDFLLPNDFLGEVVVRLKGIREIGMRQTIEDVPAVIMPLKRATEPTIGPYQVLKDRSERDKLAAQYVQQRAIMAAFKPSISVCSGFRTVVQFVKGRKSYPRTK